MLAIIPARGGSKGIPGKNIVPLCGKPLLAWTIEAAKAASYVDRLVVSTDDPEITGVAREYGAEVIERPAEISGDTASSESALLHALDALHAADAYEPELVVFLQPTSPLRREYDIDNAVETLHARNADSLFSARHVEGFIWQTDGHAPSPLDYDPATRSTRQKLSRRALEENGSIYVFKPSILRKHGARLGGEIAAYLMHPLDSFQVDTPEDIDLLEALFRLRPPRATAPPLDRVRLLVLDFDGVMTDNRVHVCEDGSESVWCHRGDGWGLARLRDAGLEVVVLSTEANRVVAARCAKLQIECVHGCDHKSGALEDLVGRRGLSLDAVAYVGNDVNDLHCMQRVGWPIAVADAAPEIIRVARWVTRRRGGDGAVREVADWLLQGNSDNGPC